MPHPNDLIDARTIDGWGDVELNQLYILRTPVGKIDSEGMYKIRSYLWTALEAKLDDISDDWVVTDKESDGGRTGTFPKRAAKLLFDKEQKNLTADQKAHIGNIARTHTIMEEEFIFDIDGALDWAAGEYGDSGSCFWGENTACRLALADQGHYAIRTYHRSSRLTIDDHLEGIGRAWMIKVDTTKALAPSDHKGYVLVNAYGPHSLTDLGKSLARAVGWQSSDIKVSNNSSGFHFNNRRAAVYVAPDADNIEAVKIDLDVDSGEYGEACGSCGEVIDLDYMMYVEWLDCSLCEDCYSDEVGHCETCENDLPQEDMIYEDDKSWCEYCYDDNYTECEVCDEHAPNDDIQESYSIGDVCSECWDDVMVFCEGCNDYTEREGLFRENECPYCEESIDGGEYIGSPFEGWIEVLSARWDRWIIKCAEGFDAIQYTLESVMPRNIYIHMQSKGHDMKRRIGGILAAGYTAVYNPTQGVRQIELGNTAHGEDEAADRFLVGLPQRSL